MGLGKGCTGCYSASAGFVHVVPQGYRTLNRTVQGLGFRALGVYRV